jgi:mRNA interferase MazF
VAKSAGLIWDICSPHGAEEQTGRRPVIVWQSDILTRLLHSVMIVPLTTNMQRAGLVGTVLITSTVLGPREDSLAVAFRIRTIPKTARMSRIRMLSAAEMAELEAATDEALGRAEANRDEACPECCEPPVGLCQARESETTKFSLTPFPPAKSFTPRFRSIVDFTRVETCLRCGAEVLHL